MEQPIQVDHPTPGPSAKLTAGGKNTEDSFIFKDIKPF
jgi:hypothetical protein